MIISTFFPVPEDPIVSLLFMAESYSIVCVSHFLCSFLCPYTLRLQQCLCMETSLARMAWVSLSLKMSLLPDCMPRHVTAVSEHNSIFSFKEPPYCFLLVDEP